MMDDWKNDDVNFINVAEQNGETTFEKTQATTDEISEQEYFDHGVLW